MGQQFCIRKTEPPLVGIPGRNDMTIASFPVSFAQQRLWLLDQLEPHNPAYNIPAGLWLSGPLNIGTLESAMTEVVRRHEILRTEFHTENGEPVQNVLPAIQMRVPIIDLDDVPLAKREAHALQLATEEARKPFHLSQGPLLRFSLVRLAALKHLLLITAHNTVFDGFSTRVLLGEVAQCYDAALRDQPCKPPEPAIQYGNFAVRQRQSLQSDELKQQLAYWKRQLSGAPSSIDLPTDRPRPPMQSFRGVRQTVVIAQSLLERLRALSRDQGVTLFMTLLAGFNVLLSRYSGQEDLVLGTTVAGRNHPELEQLIGLFANTLMLRTDVSGDPSVVELLQRVRRTVTSAYANQDMPFERLVGELNPERDMSRHPLFQIMFGLQDAARERFEIAGLTMTLLDVESKTEKFDLSVTLEEGTDGLKAAFSYRPDLFEATTIARMMEHFRILLDSAVEKPEQKISKLPWLTEAERHQLLVEWNNTTVDYPRNIPLNKFIEDQVERTPDSVALIYESEQLSYRQLNTRANQLAHRLKKLGVGPDVLVAVLAERSVEMVVALLGIIKAGGAYVPLDPEYPTERLAGMLEDAKPRVLLTQEQLLDRVPIGATHVICLDRDWGTLQQESTANLPVEVIGKNLAYAIYTSGSTGKPKGVPNVHEGIVNRLLWMQGMYQLTAADRVLQKTPFSFDVSVWEFFWPLMTGAALVVARPGGHRDAAYLVNLIAKQGITTIHFVPSMLGIFLETGGLERCNSLRQVFASGEALSFELQQRFFERLRAKLHNLYGPTEAAVDVTYWACRREGERPIVPIGRPISNTQIYILDPNLQPAPIGVAGELHIGGIGLARGYLNRPDLTAQKFIPNPFSQEPGARLYKTGDLARFLPDGNIEYLGRIDNQVKLRGFRIELGEIEAVLEECTGVRQAVVVVREDRPNDKRLVAYLVPISTQDLGIDSLRQRLEEKLPEFMAPSKFVVMDEFPMTTSGKVDRRALPAPDWSQAESASSVAARDSLELMLVDIWKKALGIPNLGVTDNFFDLGGHSLLAARLLSEVEKIAGRQLPLSALFRGATVESLAQLIREGSETSPDPVLTEIQAGESGRVPFFGIASPGVETLGFALLARHMGPDHPVYKLQGQAPIVGDRPFTDPELRSLSQEYIAAMRAVQPEGPYCFGGMCEGVQIGERMVLDLEAQGEEVGLFAIFDTWVLQNVQRPWLWRLDYYRQRLRALRKLDLAEQVQVFKKALQSNLRMLAKSGKPEVRSDWQQTYWPETFAPSRFRAPVALFKRPKQPFYYINDPQMGWGTRTESGVEIHEIDFRHQEILREPHVGTLGEQLAMCVQRVSRRTQSQSTNEVSAAADSATYSGRV
jgi:amino acid adenylation domain-containing protein